MSIYDEIEIEDMDFNASEKTFYYPCPCGDKFFITLEDLYNGEDIAKCPSCSLQIRVIYDADTLEEQYPAEEDEKESPQAVSVH